MIGRIFERPIFSTSISSKYMPVRSCNKDNKNYELTKTTTAFYELSRECGVIINRFRFLKSALDFNDEIFKCGPGSSVPTIKPRKCVYIV